MTEELDRVPVWCQRIVYLCGFRGQTRSGIHDHVNRRHSNQLSYPPPAQPARTHDVRLLPPAHSDHFAYLASIWQASPQVLHIQLSTGIAVHAPVRIQRSMPGPKPFRMYRETVTSAYAAPTGHVSLGSHDPPLPHADALVCLKRVRTSGIEAFISQCAAVLWSVAVGLVCSRRARTRPGRTRPGRTRPGRTRPGRTRPGRTRPGSSSRVPACPTVPSARQQATRAAHKTAPQWTRDDHRPFHVLRQPYGSTSPSSGSTTSDSAAVRTASRSGLCRDIQMIRPRSLGGVRGAGCRWPAQNGGAATSPSPRYCPDPRHRRLPSSWTWPLSGFGVHRTGFGVHRTGLREVNGAWHRAREPGGIRSWRYGRRSVYQSRQ
jgi:hypothetical protein